MKRDYRLAEWQAMADATAKAYGRWGGGPVVVLDDNNPLGNLGWYQRGHIRLHSAFLQHRHRRALFAHELGHFIDGGGTAQHELDADARAVEILIRVKRLTPEAAFREMLTWREDSARRFAVKRWPLGVHLVPCDEVASLVSRFPAMKVSTLPECALSR